jgi:UDP-3-O-[3-hydroxymyristoyl] glucosamine N-acyltransferase
MLPEYTILHDKNLPICFVGNTQYNHMLFNDLKEIRKCQLLTVEKVLDQSDEWRSTQQFFSACSNISFKKFVAEKLGKTNWVSIIGKNNAIHNHVDIGWNVYIHFFNSVLPTASIGSHSTVTTHCVIGHKTVVNNFCHIGPYTSLHYVDLGQGGCVGTRTTISGQFTKSISIADNTNIMFESSIRKSIVETGTYHNLKKIDSMGSCDRALLK